MVIKINKKVFILLLAVIMILSATVISDNVISVNSVLKTNKLPIAMYHQLTKDSSKSGKYVLTVEQFENDLIFLKSRGYKTINLTQLLEYSNGKGDLPEKSIMITFDDGCETLYAYALPLLEKYGFCAVGFVVGALADEYTENGDHNLSYSYLNWEEIKALCDGGVIDIQSHSYNLHKNSEGRSGMKKKKSESLKQYSEFLTEDMAKMKIRMKEHIGKEPYAIAYPFGSFSEETKDIIRNYGFKMAFTCEEKVNIIKKSESDWLFRLGRYNRPEGISSESFFNKMGIG